MSVYHEVLALNKAKKSEVKQQERIREQIFALLSKGGPLAAEDILNQVVQEFKFKITHDSVLYVLWAMIDETQLYITDQTLISQTTKNK